MLNTIKNATVKVQMAFALIFFVAYFSPIIGVAIYAFVRFKKKDCTYGKMALLGAIAALAMYALDYSIYMLS